MFLQRLSRLAGPALSLGGLLWIAIHVLVVIAGLTTGKLVIALPPAQQPLIAHVYYLLLPISYVMLCVGLLGGFARLEGHAGWVGTTGFVLSAIATFLCCANLVFTLMNAAALDGFWGVAAPLVNGLSGLFALVATLFLGCAALRVPILPRILSWVLIAVGIITLPLLLLTPLPVGPSWATDTIAFFISGIGFTTVGLRMLALANAWRSAGQARPVQQS